jgi:hypothetical protein
MSAVSVSRACYDKYAATNLLAPALRDDIDGLAGHFFRQGRFESLFINRLVPWDELTGEPNAGDAAVADLLLSGAARAVLSANFDIMIEQWSCQRKVALRGALHGQGTEIANLPNIIRAGAVFHRGKPQIAAIHPPRKCFFLKVV